jgi:DNA-binding transcriptional LysR family regulator
MELRHLRYFVAVAEELHFGRAAERVHIAQPPLSKQIRQLEEEIGVKLFQRTKRRVRLTHAGDIFLDEARQVLDQCERAVRSAQRAERGEIGRLIVSFVATASYSFVPVALRAYRKLFPDVELVLRELTTEEQLKALHMGSVHVGFLRQPISDPVLRIETVLREPLVVVLPADHALASSPSIALERLAREPFVMFSRQQGTTFYDRIVSLCHQAGFSPRVVQEALQMPTALGLVSVGIGVALAPASVQNFRMTGVVFKNLTEVRQTTELAMAWRRDEESPALLAFLDVVRDVAPPAHGRHETAG